MSRPEAPQGGAEKGRKMAVGCNKSLNNCFVEVFTEVSNEVA